MELPDHDCPLRPIVLAQQKTIDEKLPALGAKLEAALVLIAKLERSLYGKKSEKMPPVAEAVYLGQRELRRQHVDRRHAGGRRGDGDAPRHELGADGWRRRGSTIVTPASKQGGCDVSGGAPLEGCSVLLLAFVGGLCLARRRAVRR